MVIINRQIGKASPNLPALNIALKATNSYSPSATSEKYILNRDYWGVKKMLGFYIYPDVCSTSVVTLYIFKCLSTKPKDHLMDDDFELVFRENFNATPSGITHNYVEIDTDRDHWIFCSTPDKNETSIKIFITNIESF